MNPRGCVATVTTMCLAIPAVIKQVNDDGTAVVDVFGNEAIVDVTLIENPKPGDKVMVHAGAAIAKVDEEIWKESYEVWKQMLEAMGMIEEQTT